MDTNSQPKIETRVSLRVLVLAACAAIRDPRLSLAGWRIGRRFGPVECQRVYHWIGRFVIGAAFDRDKAEVVLRDTLIMAGQIVKSYPTLDYNGLMRVVAKRVNARIREDYQ